jgi:ArsR family transcriptional regulator
MLDEARKYLEKTIKNGAAVSLRIGQLEHLPLGDGEVQSAVMCLALHHLSAPEKGIREARRVLSAGGRFILADFDRHNDETLRTRLGDRWLGFAPEKIDAWLTEAGFNIIETVLFPLPKGLKLRLVAAEKLP